MRLKLTRLGCDVELSEERCATLQVEDRTLFTRIVRSLLSEKGEYAEEPYLLLKDDGKVYSPKGALLVINTLPELPLGDRKLLGKLYKQVIRQLELNPVLHEAIGLLAAELRSKAEEATDGLWGDYQLAATWSFESYLKAFSLSPIAGEDYSLLDNCMRFVDLWADVGDGVPLVLVNSKSFFSETELEELVSHSVFSGIRLLLLESWKDELLRDFELKTAIDQDFYIEI